MFKTENPKKTHEEVLGETLVNSDIRKISRFRTKYSLIIYCFLKINSTFAIRN
jgi:hypothetical protein